jgi:hypothetical protein
VRALTRRGLGTASSVIRHGPLTFDATGRVAYINDQMVELSAREISLLEVLLQRAGRLVSKDQLVTRLCEWGEEVSNNAIEVSIHRCAAWATASRRSLPETEPLRRLDAALAASGRERAEMRSPCVGSNAAGARSCTRHEAHN